MRWATRRDGTPNASTRANAIAQPVRAGSECVMEIFEIMEWVANMRGRLANVKSYPLWGRKTAEGQRKFERVAEG